MQNRCAGKLEWHHDGPPDGGSDLVCLAESPDASGGAVEASSLCVEAASPEASAEEGAAVSGEEGALEAWRAGVWTYLNTTGPVQTLNTFPSLTPFPENWLPPIPALGFLGVSGHFWDLFGDVLIW